MKHIRCKRSTSGLNPRDITWSNHEEMMQRTSAPLILIEPSGRTMPARCIDTSRINPHELLGYPAKFAHWQFWKAIAIAQLNLIIPKKLVHPTNSHQLYSSPGVRRTLLTGGRSSKNSSLKPLRSCTTAEPRTSDRASKARKMVEWRTCLHKQNNGSGLRSYICSLSLPTCTSSFTAKEIQKKWHADINLNMKIGPSDNKKHLLQTQKLMQNPSSGHASTSWVACVFITYKYIQFVFMQTW